MAELQSDGIIGEVEVVHPTMVDVAYTWSWPGSHWREDAIAALGGARDPPDRSLRPLAVPGHRRLHPRGPGGRRRHRGANVVSDNGSAPSSRAPSIAPVDPTDGRDRPYWSVMIPTYDSGPLLRRTLETVLAQDPGPADMQIEVVDDHSTADDPEELARAVAGDRVTCFRQPRNVGAVATFNECVRRARGRFVHILHSDDLVLPDFYAAYRGHLETHDDAVMAVAQSFLIDERERFTGVTPPADEVAGYLDHAHYCIATVHPFTFPSVVVARSAFEALGGFDESLPHSNDWEMWARLAAAGRVAYLPTPHAMYRVHAGSDTNRLHDSGTYLPDALHTVDLVSARFADPRGAPRSGARRCGW